MKTFIEATEDYLKDVDKPKTIKEIYDNIKNEVADHQGDPYYTLSGILSQNVKKSNSKFIVTDYNKPRKLWLKDRFNELASMGIAIEDEDNSTNDDVDKTAEADLYPVLINALKEKSIYAKRIDESISERGSKGLNQWIHPDIVGVQYYFEEHIEEVNDLINNAGESLFELYSYEVKKEVSLSTLKKSFFQAVSNSSWANYGYLVCENIDESNDELKEEINRLSNSFGIGVLKLNKKSEDRIEIIAEAKKRELDFVSLENLCKKNDNFKQFISDINSSLKIRRNINL